MPTRVAAYLTELGFKEIETAAQAVNYNKDTAGQYLIVTALNRIYRYEENSSEVADGVRVLNSSVNTAKWVTIGGSDMRQERITGTLGTSSSTITLNNRSVTKAEILYVNIANTQVLSSQYSVTQSGSNTVITLTQTLPAQTEYEIVIFTGTTQLADNTDFAILPATLYQHMLAVDGSTIALNKAFTIYKKTVNSAVTLNFTMPQGYTSTLGVLTFELFIDMTAAANILWTPTIAWNGGVAPTFNQIKKYLLSFRTFDGGTSWIGNVEMEW